MVDIELLAQALRSHNHTVGEIVSVSENAGTYELEVDGTMISLAEARAILEDDEA